MISRSNRKSKIYTECRSSGTFSGDFGILKVSTLGRYPICRSEEFASSVNPLVSNVDESGNYIYIWDKVIDDLQFAYDNLPDTWSVDKGRINKWAAGALLAKVKLYQSSPYNGKNGTVNRWSEVKSLLETIIESGKDNNGTKLQAGR